MSTVPQARLIVLDPGLGPDGGHHTALLERVAGALAEGEVAESVEVYCNLNLSAKVEKRYSSDLVRIKPHFSADFYRYYNQSPKIADIIGYIAVLGEEYLGALKRVYTEYLSAGGEVNDSSVKRLNSERLLVFYPAMQWMHLMALHWAFRQIGTVGSGLEVEHRLCLMYNPGRDFSGVITSTTDWLSYKLACKSLVSFSQVRLFASDHELAEHYMYLLDLDAPLPLHPQYLSELSFTDQSICENERPTRLGKKVGLYFGDAKIEKGFVLLPHLLRRILPLIGEQDELVIQYVSQGTCPKIQEAEEKICKIGAADSRLKVIRGYLPAEKLQATLSMLDVFVFTYDATHYQNKSSGFLWLLANKSSNLIFLNESWLSREAKRLQLNTYVCSVDEFQDVISNLLSDKPGGAVTEQEQMMRVNDLFEENYRARLFFPFFKWLLSELPCQEEEKNNCI